MSQRDLPTKMFAIGDVHGCSEELAALLEKLPITADCTVVFLGDYIDRGPDSRGVIDLILALRTRCHVVTLRGNHEDMFLEFLDRPHRAGMFILNGGGATLASYAKPTGGFEIPSAHEEFFRSLRTYFETKEFFFVHAGVPDRPLSEINFEMSEQELLWIRGEFLNSQRDWGKVIVHGHTAMTQPESRRNRINVDTGCVFNNCLTAVELPERKFHSVSKITKIEKERVFRDPDSNRVANRFDGALRVMVESATGKWEMETLNFNPYGLLLRSLSPSEDPQWETGILIEGAIWQTPSQPAHFKGVVVRKDQRGMEALYGVQIQSIEIPGEGLT